MNGFLLDTNVISELVSTKPDQRVVDWMDAATEDRLFLSVMTLGEIRQGVASLPQSQKRTRLEMWLEVDLRLRFAGRILTIDEAVADRWGWIMVQDKGRTPAVVDSIIAATALRHDLRMVTRNISDFSVPGLTLINPWEI